MIQITIDQFEQLLPFVGAATEDVFHKMQPDFEMRYDRLIDQVINPDFETKALESASRTYKYMLNYIILATFIDRLHSQDIIMTDNGFGVVSNENIAPASQARVDALKTELTYKRDDSLHYIIAFMRHAKGWGETEQAQSLIKSLVWSPEILDRDCGIPGNLTFDDLKKHKPYIDAAENHLRKHFSDALIDQIISEDRNATYAKKHLGALYKMRDFIGVSVKYDDRPIDPKWQSKCFEALLRFIEQNIDDFTQYRDSTAYKANHMQDYENKADDTTFFFAG